MPTKAPPQEYRLWAYLHRQGVTTRQLQDLFRMRYPLLKARLKNPYLFTMQELALISTFASVPIMKVVCLSLGRANYEEWFPKQIRIMIAIDEILNEPLPIAKHKPKVRVYKYSSKKVIEPEQDKPSLE